MFMHALVYVRAVRARTKLNIRLRKTSLKKSERIIKGGGGAGEVR